MSQKYKIHKVDGAVVSSEEWWRRYNEACGDLLVFGMLSHLRDRFEIFRLQKDGIYRKVSIR